MGQFIKFFDQPEGAVSDPFADIQFAAAPTEENEILRVLQKPSAMDSSAGNTKDGADRVNANTKATGVTAYKDAKGRTTLTNERVIDVPVTPADKPYTDAEFNRANPLTDGRMTNPIPLNAPASQTMGQPGAVRGIDTPLDMFTALAKLRSTTDATQAAVMFEAFQQASVQQQARLEQQAVAFAEQKVGVKNLERMLMEAEQADKADPKWYPGIGDSPITQKQRSELNVARGVAITEAKNFLATNETYKSLAVTSKTAEHELNRITRLADQRTTAELNREAQSEISKQRQDETNAEYERRKQEAREQEAEGISAKQLQRIQMLNQGDFVGLDPNSIDAKVKAMALVKKNKSKDFNEAVAAEGTDLPVLALKGNAFARSLVMAEEAAATGRSQEEVARDIDALQKKMQEPKFAQSVLENRYGKGEKNKKERQEALGIFTATNFDPAKKNEATTAKAQMAMEYMAHLKTAKFVGDVGTWAMQAVDPVIRSEIELATTSARKTTGRADIEHTLIAFLGNTEGPARAAKGSAFLKAMELSARQHEKSVFGMPNYREGSAIVVKHMQDSGFFRTWMQKIGALEVGSDMSAGLLAGAGVGVVAATAGAPVTLAAGIGAGTYMLGRAFVKPLLTDATPLIDPATGRPFGE